MKIAITGGSGLVGSHVVEEARRRGFAVRALIRPSSDKEFLVQQGVEIVIGDLHDRHALRSLCQGVDALVNCAARVGDWGRLDEFRKDNVDALLMLLDESSLAGVKRIVHISSLGVYAARDHHGTDESVLPAIDSLDAYTRSKTEAEILLLAYATSGGAVVGAAPYATYGKQQVMLPYVAQQLARSEVPPASRLREVTVLRPGFIYGQRDRTVLPKLMSALQRNQFFFFGDGSQALNAVHAGNVAQAVFCAFESSPATSHVFNVTDGCAVSKRDFVAAVADAMGIPVPVRKIPLPVARLVASVVHDFASWAGSAKPPLINKARFKFLGLHLDYSIEKARHELGYSPNTEWRSLLRDAVKWQKLRVGPS